MTARATASLSSRTLLALAAVLFARPVGKADTVVLKSGKTLEGVMVGRADEEVVVLNPWNSRHPGMTWEIPEQNRIPRAEVESISTADAPLVEYRRRSVTPGATAVDRVALAEKRDQAEGRRLRADLLLVRGDPTKDILATRDIVAVWKCGARVDREWYRDRVEEASR